MALKGYTSNDYNLLNSALRSKDPTQLTLLEAYIKCVKSGLRQLPKHIGDVFHGTTLPESVLSRYSLGATVTEDAFTSTSAKLGAEFPGNVKYSIYSHTGRRVDFFSDFPNELEALFAPQTRFKIVANRINTKTGIREIEMEEVVGGSK